MANINAPFGLRLVSMFSESTNTVSIRRYRIPDTEPWPVFVGDAVMKYRHWRNSGLVDQMLNLQEGLIRLEKPYGDGKEPSFLGAVVGFAYDPVTPELDYRPSYTERDVFVCDDPNAIYEVQSDATGITADQLGKNCYLFVYKYNIPPNHISSSVAYGATLSTRAPLLIVGWSKDQNNDITSPPYVKVLVKLRNPQLTTGIEFGPVGV